MLMCSILQYTNRDLPFYQTSYTSVVLNMDCYSIMNVTICNKVWNHQASSVEMHYPIAYFFPFQRICGSLSLNTESKILHWTISLGLFLSLFFNFYANTYNIDICGDRFFTLYQVSEIMSHLFDSCFFFFIDITIEKIDLQRVEEI